MSSKPDTATKGTEPTIVHPKDGELLPCPFCGSPAGFEHDNNSAGQWHVFCRDNQAEAGCTIGLTNSDGYPRRVDAAAAWNRRASADTSAQTKPENAIVSYLRRIYDLQGDTYSSSEVFGAINRAANEIERLSASAQQVQSDLADWSSLPRDLYVVSVKSADGIVFDVQCCSVPMAIGPEVRYSLSASPWGSSQTAGGSAANVPAANAAKATDSGLTQDGLAVSEGSSK